MEDYQVTGYDVAEGPVSDSAAQAKNKRSPMLIGIMYLLIIIIIISAAAGGCTGDLTNVNHETESTEPLTVESMTEKPTYPELKIEVTNDGVRNYETINYYFIPDDEALGEWKAFAEIQNYAESMYVNFNTGEVKFRDEKNSLEDYINYNLENDILFFPVETIKLDGDGKAKVTEVGNISFFTEWTQGHIIDVYPDMISKYIIKNIGGNDYLFIDYREYRYLEALGEKPTFTQGLIILKKISGYVPGGNVKYDAIAKNYDWYVAQDNTGEYSSTNCGPACAVMAAKWHDKDFAVTVEEARNRIDYIDENNGWNILTIKEFFDSESIPHEIYTKIKYSDVMTHLNMGNIMIVPVHMKYIKKNNFTNSEAFHSIVIKGKRTVDGQEYFQVQDPALGWDCLYACDELIEAALNHGGWYIVVQNREANAEPAASLPSERIPEYIDIKGSLFNTAWTEIFLYNKNFEDSDIEPLKYMTNLKNLSLANNSISNISVLAGLKNLEELNLHNNQISDISALANLPNLTVLILGNNQISDISPLENLPNLSQQVVLANNPISDISPLAALKNLQRLNLSNTQISDAGVLAEMTNLKVLEINETELNDKQIEELRKALPNTAIIDYDYWGGVR